MQTLEKGLDLTPTRHGRNFFKHIINMYLQVITRYLSIGISHLSKNHQGGPISPPNSFKVID